MYRCGASCSCSLSYSPPPPRLSRLAMRQSRPLAGFYSVAPGSLVVAVPDLPGFLFGKQLLRLEMQPRGSTQTFPMTVVANDSAVVSALVPADVPIGWTTVTMTTNQSAISGSVYVSRSSFGLFHTGISYNGPAVAQNIDDSGRPVLNRLTSPASPGQYVTLWGSGLGDFTTPRIVSVPNLRHRRPAFLRRPRPGPARPGPDQLPPSRRPPLPAATSPSRSPSAAPTSAIRSTLAIATSPATACAHPLGLSPVQLSILDQGGTIVAGSLGTTDIASPDDMSGAFVRYEYLSFSLKPIDARGAFTGALDYPSPLSRPAPQVWL